MAIWTGFAQCSSALPSILCLSFAVFAGPVYLAAMTRCLFVYHAICCALLQHIQWSLAYNLFFSTKTASMMCNSTNIACIWNVIFMGAHLYIFRTTSAISCWWSRAGRQGRVSASSYKVCYTTANFTFSTWYNVSLYTYHQRYSLFANIRSYQRL